MALLRKLGSIFDKQELTPAQRDKLVKTMYKGFIPEVDKTMQADPATAVANNLITTGTNTAPLAGGMTEGIARALSGLAGGQFSKQQQQKYAALESGMMDDWRTAAKPTVAAANAEIGARPPAPPGVVPPAPAGPPPQQLAASGANAVAGALTRPPPMAAPPAPAVPAQAPGVAPQATGPFPRTLTTPVPASPASTAQLVQPGPRVLQPGDPAGVSRRVARLNAITQQSESGGNPNAVSPVGARGLMQVMPSTARDPGFGIKPSDGTPADDVRVGKEYRAKMEARYGGDLPKMWAAYNAGPGATDRRIKRYGADWLSHMPAETQNYVAKNLKAMGGADVAPAAADGAATNDNGIQAQNIAIPDMPAAPVRPALREMGDTPKSIRMEFAERLLNGDSATSDASSFLFGRPAIEQGMTDVQKIRDQRESDIQGQLKTDDTAALNLYNDNAKTSYDQPYSERTAAIAAQNASNLQAQQDRAAAARNAADNAAAITAAQAKASNPKNLPAGIRKDLKEHSDTMAQILNLQDTFSQDYFGTPGGNVVAGAMDTAANAWANVSGSESSATADRQRWWKAYDTMQSKIRHGLYGSALTDTEKADWDKANISHGTPGADAQKIFHDRAIMSSRAMLKTIAEAEGGNYDPEQIAGAIGPQYQRILALAQEKTSGDIEREQKAATRQGRPAGTTRQQVKAAPARKQIGGTWYVEDASSPSGWSQEGG